MRACLAPHPTQRDHQKTARTGKTRTMVWSGSFRGKSQSPGPQPRVQEFPSARPQTLRQMARSVSEPQTPPSHSLKGTLHVTQVIPKVEMAGSSTPGHCGVSEFPRFAARYKPHQSYLSCSPELPSKAYHWTQNPGSPRCQGHGRDAGSGPWNAHPDATWAQFPRCLHWHPGHRQLHLSPGLVCTHPQRSSGATTGKWADGSSKQI